jgi:glycosyltransferase involved in cell wall biosynthesis
MGEDLSVIHVLPTISRAGGGVSEFARLLTVSLAKQLPNRVSVLTTRDGFSIEDRAGWGNVPVSFVRAFPPRKFCFAPGLLLELLRRRPAIVHLHGLWNFPCAAALVWSWFTRKGIVIITVQGMLDPWILRRSPRLKSLVNRLYQNKLITRADCIHVLTEKEKEDVTRIYPDAPTAIIPNFVAAEEVATTERPTWWEPSLEGREIFLFLGRFHEKKGCGELLRAWEVLSTDLAFRDKYELVFCGWSDGDNTFLADLARLRERLGNVRYVGAQFGVEKARTLGAARFFVLPSKSEGMPMAILEAWQAGLVVIMTAQCNLPIGFSQGAALETGLSEELIAESLLRAARMPEQDRRTMAEAGKMVVGKFYSRDVVTRAIRKLYSEIEVRKRGKNAVATRAAGKRTTQ